MNTQEEWKAIAECNGQYYVSNWGRVKSFKFGKERILKPYFIGYGLKYACYSIMTNKVRKICKVHRLVALAFIENPQNKTQINHCDGDKSNNVVWNLEWVTASENIQHAWDTGLCEKVRLSKTKQVIDITNGKKYDSLKFACEDIDEPYSRHGSRIFYKSKLQRFFYTTDGNR